MSSGWEGRRRERESGVGMGGFGWEAGNERDRERGKQAIDVRQTGAREGKNIGS